LISNSGPGDRAKRPGRRCRSVAALALGLAVAACTGRGSAEASFCHGARQTGRLPSYLSESSGVAASRRHPGVLWTHNDSGDEPVVYAIDSTGAVLSRVRVAGAENADWEDIALGPCPAGDCLYIADTGDNEETRREVVVYRVPEPAPGDTVTAPAERFRARFPDAPQDAEALFVLPRGEVFLVTKGRSRPVAVYRYPQPLGDAEGPGPKAKAVELERVQQLTPGPVPLIDGQVTGAAATPDGRWVAIRTYSTLLLYRVDGQGRLTLVVDWPGVELRTLGERQGEGVEILSDGTVLLTSESGVGGEPAPISRLSCALRGAPRPRRAANA